MKIKPSALLPNNHSQNTIIESKCLLPRFKFPFLKPKWYLFTTQSFISPNKNSHISPDYFFFAETCSKVFSFVKIKNGSRSYSIDKYASQRLNIFKWFLKNLKDFAWFPKIDIRICPTAFLFLKLSPSILRFLLVSPSFTVFFPKAAEKSGLNWEEMRRTY